MKTHYIINTLKGSVCVLALMLFTAPAFSQGTLAIGAKAGFAQSYLEGSDIEEISLKNSVAGGLFLKFNPVPFFAIQPEFLLRKKGSTNERPLLNTREEYNINYFEIPVLFKLRLPIGGVVYPNIYGGPYYAYATEATYTATQTNTDIAVERNVEVNRTDYGGIVGGGVDVEFSFLMLSLDARYGFGGNEVEKDNNNDALDFRNRDWTIMAGVGVLLGK